MKNSFFVLILIGLIFVTYRTIDDLNAKNTHPGDMSCDGCHLARSEIDETNAHILVASQEELCKSCHPNAVAVSHPSGIKPVRVPPPNFPLDWKGELTCSTCHAVHGSERGLLRVKSYGRALCLSCHDDSFFSTMLDGGTSLMSFGHLDARASRVGDIDSFSVRCMSCHDSLPDDLNVRLSGDVIRHNNDQAAHPIGMRYDRSTSNGSYHPAALLPQEIVLPDGKVSCISCHEGYSEKHGKLVMDNTGSRLCFSCHNI